MTEAVAWSGGLARPRVSVPEGATDCQFHVYDGRYPAAPGTALQHPDAGPEDYRALQRRLGTTRGVLVQPSTHGTDNRLHFDALQALGADRFRMVAVVAPDVAEAEIRRLHEAGVRGVRFKRILAARAAGRTRPGFTSTASLWVRSPPRSRARSPRARPERRAMRHAQVRLERTRQHPVGQGWLARLR